MTVIAHMLDHVVLCEPGFYKSKIDEITKYGGSTVIYHLLQKTCEVHCIWLKLLCLYFQFVNLGSHRMIFAARESCRLLWELLFRLPG